ncbi:Hsp70 family protein, partial [Enterococcus faecalis]|uniref:Hsp70 family protein n=1 Tax=Enterococcus faecalis TaxID=1351 RepID=UPI0030C7D42E
RHVGEVAKRQAGTQPNPRSSIKRPRGEAGYKGEGDGTAETPQEGTARSGQEAKGGAEDEGGEKGEKAGRTGPADGNEAQRQETKEAWKRAGLEGERIGNEPTAAAGAAGGAHTDTAEKRLVWDLGGGTVDVSSREGGEGGGEGGEKEGDNNLGG